MSKYDLVDRLQVVLINIEKEILKEPKFRDKKYLRDLYTQEDILRKELRKWKNL